MQRPWWDTAHSEARRPRNVARHSLLPRMRPFSLATRRRRSFALHPPQPRRMRTSARGEQGREARLRGQAGEDAASLADARAQEGRHRGELAEAQGVVERQPYTREQAQAMNADRWGSFAPQRSVPVLYAAALAGAVRSARCNKNSGLFRYGAASWVAREQGCGNGSEMAGAVRA